MQIQVRKEEWLLWLSLPASLYQQLSVGNRCLTSTLPRLNSTPALFSFLLYPGSLCENWTRWMLLLWGGIYSEKLSWSCFEAYACMCGHLFIKSWVCELWRSVLVYVRVCLRIPPASSNRSQVVCGDCKCLPMDFCGWPSLNRFWLDGITCFVIQRNNSVHTPSPFFSPHKLLCFLCWLTRALRGHGWCTFQGQTTCDLQ